MGDSITGENKTKNWVIFQTMNEEKANQIIQAYREAVAKTEEALRLSGMPDNMIAIWTLNFPVFNRLIPEDAIKIYKNIHDGLIIYLDSIGFSYREISRRLGGSGTTAVFETLKRYREPEEKIKKGMVEEVMKEEVENGNGQPEPNGENV